jgi:coenzyme F420-dependent glucose-6-phosphate dehydrogenase
MLGFHFSHEQHSPSTLLRYAQLVHNAGFTTGMCSDHLQPWSERQGESGFAWSWLGAVLATTRLSCGTVCAPGQRYHPVIVAQAAATLAEMFPHRMWMAVGSGEALNESITGDPWPSKSDRNARLKDSVDMIRALWAGETVSMDRHVKAKQARLYVRPATPPLLLGAALTEETARWLGTWADGLITVNLPHDQLRRVVESFLEAAGAHKPMYLQVALSFAGTDEEAMAAAHDQWRQCTLSVNQVTDLPTVAEMDAACQHATPEDVRKRLRISSDVARHIEWLQQDRALGFDRIFLHNVARAHQERFIETCATRIAPALGS